MSKQPNARDEFASFLQRRERGEPIDFAAFCAERPALREELAQLRRELDDASQLCGFQESSLLRSALRVLLDPPTPSPSGEQPMDSQWRRLMHRLAVRQAASGRYRIDGEVARGGMGTILKAWDDEIERTLAMKVLRGKDDAAPGADDSTLVRFLDEAKITGQLDHPGIVPVHELGVDSTGRVYFTMPLLKGRTLREVFECVGRGEDGWTRTRALGVLLKVGEAMSYAHAKGVLHRDLKPSNVMVGRFGEVYVMDWGLARVLGQAERRDIRLRPAAETARVRSEREGSTDDALFTMDGTIVGTPAYMSPEQARGQVDLVDARSDVYGLGAMLYELLAGQTPYIPRGATASPHMVVRWVLDGPPTPLATTAPDAPAELVSICDKAMAREAGARYASMADLVEDLRAYLEGRVVHAHEQGAFAELRKWVARNRLVAAAVAAAVLLAVLAAGTLSHSIAQAGELKVVREAQQETEGALAQASRAQEQTRVVNEQLASTNEQLATANRTTAAALTEREAALARERRQAAGLRLLSGAPSGPPGLRLALGLEAGQRLPLDSVNQFLFDTLRDLHEERRLVGHTEMVTCGALDVTGTRLVTGDRAGGLRVWDLEHGHHHGLPGKRTPVQTVAFVRGGQIVAVDRTGARLLDATTGTTARTARMGRQPLSATAVSPDGRWVAAGSDRGVLWLWDLESGTEHQVPAHTKRIHSAAFSPDSQLLAAAAADGVTSIWRIGADGLLPVQRLTTDEPDTEHRVAAFRGDGQRLAVGINSEAVVEWDVGTWDVVRRVDTPGGWITSIDYSTDGTHMVVAGMHSRSWLSTRDGEAFPLDNGTRSELACFSPDGTRIAMGSIDGTVTIWDAATRTQSLLLKGHDKRCMFLKWLSGGTRLASGGEDGSVRLWSLANPSFRERTIPAQGRAIKVAWSPNGGTAYCMADRLGVWQPTTNQMEWVDDPIQDFDAVFHGLIASPDGQRLVTTRDNHGVLRDAAGRPLCALVGHEGILDEVVFAPDARTVLTASHGRRLIYYYPGRNQFSPEDNTVRIWDARTGAPIANLDGHRAGVRAAAFDPLGRFVATASRDHSTIVWDAHTWHQLRQLPHGDEVADVAFTADGATLLTGSWDGLVRLWNTTTWESQTVPSEVAPTRGGLLGLLGNRTRRPAIGAAAISPDGSTLVTMVEDGTCRAWNGDGSSRSVFRLHSGNTGPNRAWDHGPNLLLGNGGTMAISVSEDMDLRAWDTNTGAQVLHLDGVVDVALSPDGRRLLLAQRDRVLVCPLDALQEASRRRPFELSSDERLRFDAHRDAAPTNLSFDSGEPGAFPPGWSTKPPRDADEDAVIEIAAGGVAGSRCARIHRPVVRKAGSGNLAQSVYAGPYRGHRIRLRAAVRVEDGGDDPRYRAQLWLRVDAARGEQGAEKHFRNQADLAIRGTEWTYHEVVGVVSPEDEWVHFGVLEIGAGTTYLDDVSLEIVD